MQQQKRKASKKIGDDSSTAIVQALSPHLGITNQQSQQAYLNILEDMQAERQEMEEQRMATFNIMEDVTETQEALQARYRDLDTLRELVNNLGSSLKTTQVMEKLVRALKNSLPLSTNLVYLIPSPDPGMVSNLAYVHAAIPLSLSYLNAVKEDLKLFVHQLPFQKQEQKQFTQWLQGKFRFEFVEGELLKESEEAQVDKIEEDKYNVNFPFSSYCVPIMVFGEILGVINISAHKHNVFSQKNIDLANTMVGTTASTISRLRKLLESEQSRIASLVKSLSNGVVMFDENMKVTMANPAAQRMTGLPERGFYISEFNKLFAAAAAAAAGADLEESVQKTLLDGEVVRIEEVHISRFTYELLIHPVYDHEMSIIGGAIILHDITQLKAIDKMKTEFVSLASHQLRTPLTGINWNLEMLLSGDAGKLNEAQLEVVQDLLKGSKRMVKLVNDLLNMSRLETGRLAVNPQPINLVSFVRDIITECEPLLEKSRCCVSLETNGCNPTLGLDPSLMRQVVHNLLTNAIKYSAGGKKRAITVDVSKAEENSHYVVSVSDTGIGIPERVQKRIFEKFYRADNAIQTETEGNGLGLYVAKMIAKASGGDMWFESVEGKGTTFYVSIPTEGMKEKTGEKGLA